MKSPQNEESQKFWEAFRACAEENRVRPGLSVKYETIARHILMSIVFCKQGNSLYTLCLPAGVGASFLGDLRVVR